MNFCGEKKIYIISVSGDRFWRPYTPSKTCQNHVGSMLSPSYQTLGGSDGPETWLSCSRLCWQPRCWAWLERRGGCPAWIFKDIFLDIYEYVLIDTKGDWRIFRIRMDIMYSSISWRWSCWKIDLVFRYSGLPRHPAWSGPSLACPAKKGKF